MGTKSRETIYGASIRAAAERATEARKDADRLACEAWNKRMLGFQGMTRSGSSCAGPTKRIARRQHECRAASASSCMSMSTCLEEGIKLHRFAGILPEQFLTEAGRHREAVVATD